MGKGTDVLTVRAFLDAELSPSRRTHHLDDLCLQVATQPLTATVESMRAELGVRIGLEDFRRLHVLISHLYHSCGAPIPLVTRLRAEVNAAIRPTSSSTEGR